MINLRDRIYNRLLWNIMEDILLSNLVGRFGYISGFKLWDVEQYGSPFATRRTC